MRWKVKENYISLSINRRTRLHPRNVCIPEENEQQPLHELELKLTTNIENWHLQLLTTYMPCNLGSRFPYKDKTMLIH